MPGRSKLAPGDGLVGIALDQLPALALRVLSAQPELVLDRGLALDVRAWGMQAHGACLSRY